MGNTFGMKFSIRGSRGGGAQDAAPTQGNKVRLTTSWSLADRVLPPRHGAIGPPRDLGFRGSPTNGHGTTGQATVATMNQDRMMAGMPARGITQDMFQHGTGPTPGVHFQARDGSAPQYQGIQMQPGAMLPDNQA
jgi:hypothetical protein